MVSLEGKLPPFRITRGELFEIIVQIQRKLDALSSPIDNIKVTLGNYSEKCKTINEVTFLNDVFLPKVAKDIQVVIRSRILNFQFSFSGEYAKYYIDNARDTSEARSFEDLISTFFKSHSVTGLANMFGEMVIVMLSGIACFYVLQTLVQSFYFGRFLAYPQFYFLTAICLITFVAYLIWTNYTPNTPSFSFYHSLVWLKEPKTNAKWALISTILVGIVISVLSTFL